MLHCLWSADLSKNFSQWIVSIFIFLNQYFLSISIFSQYLFQYILPDGKVRGYRDTIALISNNGQFKISISELCKSASRAI